MNVYAYTVAPKAGDQNLLQDLQWHQKNGQPKATLASDQDR